MTSKEISEIRAQLETLYRLGWAEKREARRVLVNLKAPHAGTHGSVILNAEHREDMWGEFLDSIDRAISYLREVELDAEARQKRD